ncbi:hypothetical protein GQ473_03340 [archaeon]|nr:hypothetical protein [archaeon]
MANLTELFDKIELAFSNNLLLFDEVEKKFKENHKYSDSWSSSWSDYILQSNISFTNLKTIKYLNDRKEYSVALSSLRSVLEHLLFLKLYLSGIKSYKYEVYRIKPKDKDSLNPISRNITLNRWRDELKQWNKNKESKLKNYSDVVCISDKNDDEILVKRLIVGLYETNDTDEKGDYIPHYCFLFDNYDPFSNFVSSLPTIIKNSHFPETIKKQSKINKDIYHRYFSFKALISNWKLNDFINSHQEDMFLVHYNFLSFFVHPTREQTKILALEQKFYSSKNLFEYRKDGVLSLLIYLYVLKMQQLCLNILISKLDELSENSWADDVLSKLDENNAVADCLWFIYDEPTEFDVGRRVIKKTKIIPYYTDPLDRLRNYVNFNYKY